MHPKVAQAIQEIDAAVFNSDTFDSDTPEGESDRKELLKYLARWSRELRPHPTATATINDLKARLGLPVRDRR